MDFHELQRLAIQGQAVAQYNLGFMYFSGNGVSQSYREARKWHLLAAEQGHAQAQYILGFIYFKGGDIPQDYKEALKWYKLAAEQGQEEAQLSLGFMYFNGDGAERNYEKALKWYRLAAEQGNQTAQYNLGEMYYFGNGAEQDYKEALKWYKLAAKQGNVDSQNFLGEVYYFGNGAEQDYKKARKWYKLAAEQGDAEGQYCVGHLYAEGFGVKQDYKKALKWFQLAAEQGHMSAQNNVGSIYINGFGVEQDYEEALKWGRLAAKQGHMVAQYNLGVLYDSGLDVEQDYPEALKWYKLAAEQGHANARNNLGLMYFNGFGVEQDYEEALKWFQLAADLVNVNAQNNLGFMYLSGFGVEQNYEEALKWFQLAAGQGDTNAYNHLGLMHRLGCGVRQDYEEALKCYKLATEQENIESQGSLEAVRFIGNIYYLEDDNTSMKWGQLHVERICAETQFCIGQMYLEQENPDLANFWLGKAQNQEIARIQYSVGKIYFRHQSLGQTQLNAFEIIKKAAEQEYVKAQYAIGVMFEYGLGTDKNHQEAIKWYEKAIPDSNALISLYRLYKQGSFLDEEKALSYFQEKVTQDHKGKSLFSPEAALIMVRLILDRSYEDDQAAKRAKREAQNYCEKIIQTISFQLTHEGLTELVKDNEFFNKLIPMVLLAPMTEKSFYERVNQYLGPIKEAEKTKLWKHTVVKNVAVIAAFEILSDLVYNPQTGTRWEIAADYLLKVAYMERKDVANQERELQRLKKKKNIIFDKMKIFTPKPKPNQLIKNLKETLDEIDITRASNDPFNVN